VTRGRAASQPTHVSSAVAGGVLMAAARISWRPFVEATRGPPPAMWPNCLRPLRDRHPPAAHQGGRVAPVAAAETEGSRRGDACVRWLAAHPRTVTGPGTLSVLGRIRVSSNPRTVQSSRSRTWPRPPRRRRTACLSRQASCPSRNMPATTAWANTATASIHSTNTSRTIPGCRTPVACGAVAADLLADADSLSGAHGHALQVGVVATRCRHHPEGNHDAPSPPPIRPG
jgi:hypothetical protein